MAFASAFSRPVSPPIWNAGAALVFILRDEFTTPQAAPLTSPRTCEPGPGTLTITDTGNKLSIASSTLSTSGAQGANDPRLYSGAQTRAAGLALSFVHNAGATLTNDNPSYGWGTATTQRPAGFSLASILFAVGGILAGPNAAVSDTYLANTDYPGVVVLRATGSFCFVKFSGSWRLIWVDNANSTATLYAGYGVNAGSGAHDTKSMRIFQMLTPFNSDYGIATGYTASPSTGATLTHEANCLAEITWTAATGVTAEFDIRRTDADNRWIVRCSQGGSTVKLIERNAGVETERSSAAQTWTNGTSYRIVIIADGTAIRTYVANAAKNAYTSATFNQSATGAQITASSGALANFATWPRTLSGSAETELNRWTS